MGKNNRQRRAAKARRRSRSGSGHPGRGASRPGFQEAAPGPPLSPGQLLIAAAHALRHDDEATLTYALDLLAAMPTSQTLPEIQTDIEEDIADAWDRGWQPADLDRYLARRLGEDEVRLLRAAMASQAVVYQELGDRVAPGWMGQLDALGAAPTGPDLGPVLLELAPRWRDGLEVAVRLLALLGWLGELPRLMDPPSAWREGDRIGDADVPAALLAKIRALLAKAESTTFDAEAEALTAKAQELMARHRIDRAVVAESGDAPTEAVIGRRIGVDDPYADAKAVLLGGLAGANGARAVWSKELGSSTVFAYAIELDVIEELFTSLLVQATAALRREGSKQDSHGRSRTRSFRQSFLVAYAHRVTDRLREAVDETVDAVAAASGTDLVPLLATQDEAAEAAMHETFPETGTFSPSASDREGVFAGRLFGDRADLGVGPTLERRSA